MKRALRGTRVLLRSANLSIRHWPHAARTFAINTNWRRRQHALKRNSCGLRVFGHRGTAVLPRVVRDRQDVGPATTTRVMYLSHVVETAGAVWVLLPDGSVRDLLDRDIVWEAEFASRAADPSNQHAPRDHIGDLLNELPDVPEFEEVSDAETDEGASDGGSDDHEPVAGQAQLTEAVTRGRLRDFGYLDWGAAREKEASVIERFGVFEPTVEEEDVVAKHPNATVLPLLEADAVKHREKPKTEQVPRVRFVLHGGQEKGSLTDSRRCSTHRGRSKQRVRTKSERRSSRVGSAARVGGRPTSAGRT